MCDDLVVRMMKRVHALEYVECHGPSMGAMAEPPTDLDEKTSGIFTKALMDAKSAIFCVFFAQLVSFGFQRQ